MKLLALISVLLLVAGCGSSSPTPGPSPTPTPGSGGTPVQVTETYSGSTVQTAATSCGGDSHDITATDGDISVRLTATSDPAGALSIQVCGGGVDDSNCSIRQQRIAVDQTLVGAKRGASTQNVKLLPYACVFGGTPAGAPVTYTVSVTYFKLQ
jgi:hypothetical protein